MRIGRLYVQRPHGAEHWWQGVCFDWNLKRRPGDSPWVQRVRFIRVYVQ